MNLYRGMDRAALDGAYNNSLVVPDFSAIMTRFRERSAALYRQHACQRDLAYGSLPRQRLDWFSCGQPMAPVFVFIHGGYWQRCDKEDFAFVAEGPLARGFDVVLVEYTLAPAANMTGIVGEIGSMLDALLERMEDGKSRRLCLSGHSAGGHLAALHRDHPALSHVMPISALTDLEPIALSWLNDALQLTPEEIRAFSPCRRIGRGAPMTVTVGSEELPELVRHSREYVAACMVAGQSARYVPVPGCHHFSVLDDLASPEGVQMAALQQAMAL